MPSARLAAAVRILVGLAAVLAVAGGAGCAKSEGSSVPAACKAGPEAVRSALRDAPEPVRLGGETPISECFARETDQADLQTVGVTLTEAASSLAQEARDDPGGSATLELGYLIGAARRGAERTPALYDELLRRLESTLHGVDTSSEAFATGERAGRESG